MRMLAFTPAYAAIAVFLKDHALFFLFLRVKNQANQLNMQIKLQYQYF